MESIDMVTTNFSRCLRHSRFCYDYDMENVSEKVLGIIKSYTYYINCTVCYK